MTIQKNSEGNAGRDSARLTDVAGVILAGGNSSRYGSNKALAPWRGKPLISHAADTLNRIFANRLLVTNTPDVYRFLGWPMVADIYPGAGPLAGIHAALQTITEKRVFICACDMPFLREPFIRFLCRLAKEYDIAVPCSPDGPEPLCAVYAKGALPVIDQHLKAGRRKISLLFENLTVRRVEEQEILTVLPDLTAFHNVNRPEDLEAVRLEKKEKHHA